MKNFKAMFMYELGENAFIENLQKRFLAPEGMCGIGDDCAVIPWDKERMLLVSTDALSQGIHFIQGKVSLRDLGYKLVAVNLSDIAAMGGTPHSCFLSVAVPPYMKTEELMLFIDGIEEACREFQIPLLGGDTVGAERDTFFSLTILGQADASALKTRSLATPGDILFTTGPLGASYAGLQLIMEEKSEGVRSKEEEELIHSHIHPKPYLKEAQFLASKSATHAMIDVSDGFDQDLRKLLKASSCGATVELKQIPLTPSLKRVALTKGWDCFNFALAGGEDYSLLVTISKEQADEIRRQYEERFASPLTPVGTITEGSALVYQLDGRQVEIDLQTFDHFSPNRHILGIPPSANSFKFGVA